MYFKILKTAIEKRPKNSIAHIFTDEKTGINWQLINECLDSVGKRVLRIDYPIFTISNFFKNFTIQEFRPVKSSECLPVQISDFFAGMSIFSVDSFNNFDNWRKENSAQIQLFSLTKKIKFSNSEKNRFPILDKLITESRSKKLGVSINTYKRLHTFSPSNPINFWFYEPQHELDKAPIKK